MLKAPRGRGVRLLGAVGTIRGLPTLEVVLEVLLGIANPLELEICIPHIFEIRQRVLGMASMGAGLTVAEVVAV